MTNVAKQNLQQAFITLKFGYQDLITYPLGGGYVLFSPLFLTALSLSLSLSQSVISYLLFGITRPLLERE